MSNWNSFEDSNSYSSRGYRDESYQSGVFDDYAMPSRRNFDNGRLAMSVSLGPVDLNLGDGMRFIGNQNYGFDNYGGHRHNHNDRYARNDRYDRFDNYGNSGSVQWGRSQTYFTPDYNFRKGYEDFGESTYNRARGWVGGSMRFEDSFRRDYQDPRFQRNQRFENFLPQFLCPPERQQYRESYRDNYREPYRETYRQPETYTEEYRERRPEVQEKPEPTRTLPSNAMSEYDWAVYNKLCDTAKQLEGKRTTSFDKRLPTDRLGCVTAASLLVDNAYGLDTKDINTRQFEKHLREKDFTEVAVKDMKPGDVILGYRADGDYSHAAVYMGNGKIFNNDSDKGVMTTQSVDKFNSTEFKRFVILRRPPQVPSVAAA
jgi:hypothetical protein